MALGVSAAGAADASDACNTGRVCLYGNTSWEWKIGDRAEGGGLATLGGTYNDQMDSYRNITATNARVHANSDGSGDCVNVPRNSNDSNLAVWNDNEASSWRTDRGCP